MKKRKMVPYHSGAAVIATVAVSFCTLFFAGVDYSIYKECGEWPNDFIISFCLIGVLNGLIIIFGPYNRAQYTVDGEGMTVYYGKKEYRLRWEECREFGVAVVSTGQVSQIAYVYCTTVPLSEKEKRWFVWHRKKSFDTTLYFQYTGNEALKEALAYMPETAQSHIKWELRRAGAKIDW